MSDIILPSKLIPEKITLTIDFQDEMLWGETISTTVFDVRVFSGVDANPNDILFGLSIVTGTVVQQRIIAGLPGVIYLVSCTVVGSSGNDYKKQAKLAILPSKARTPLFIADYVTSRPYPVELIESISVEGFLRDSEFLTVPVDGFDVVASLQFGDLRSVFVEYSMSPEAIQVVPLLLSGELKVPLVTYTGAAEAIDVVPLLTAGSLKQVLITNTMAPEAIDVVATLMSGALT